MAYFPLSALDSLTIREWNDLTLITDQYIKFCQRVGLLHAVSTEPCPKKHHNWYLGSCAVAKDKYKWYCQTCKFSRSLRDSTFFPKSRLTLRQTLLGDSVDDAPKEEIDETYGVNVEFEDEGDDNEVCEDEEGDLSEGKEVKMDYTIHEKTFNKTSANDDFTHPSKTLQPHLIDEFWLQRNLSKVYAEATDAKLKAQEVLEILKTASDDRELENQLV
ncbi:unnamed protein product, partial [Rotaria sordida]